MPLSTKVKYFSFSQLRAPTFVSSNTSSVRNILTKCLVEGHGDVPVLDGTVTAGICRMRVASGNSFSIDAVVRLAGCDQSGANGDHRITSMGDLFFEFQTTLPNGPITGSAITAKYAPAGWIKPFPDSGNVMVIRSGDTSATSRQHYLRITESSSSVLNVKAYRTMTDINSGTGVYPPTPAAGYFWPRADESNAFQRAWGVIATDKFFFWICHPAIQSLNMDLRRSNSVAFFGQFIPKRPTDPNNVVLNGRTSANMANSYSNEGSYSYQDIGASTTVPNSYLYLAGPFDVGSTPMTGAMFAPVPSSSFLYGISGQTNFSNRDPFTGEIEVTRVNIIDSNGFERGYIPGLFYVKSGVKRSMSSWALETGYGDFINRKLLGLYTTAGSTYAYQRHTDGVDLGYVLFDIFGIDGMDWS